MSNERTRDILLQLHGIGQLLMFPCFLGFFICGIGAAYGEGDEALLAAQWSFYCGIPALALAFATWVLKAWREML